MAQNEGSMKVGNRSKRPELKKQNKALNDFIKIHKSGVVDGIEQAMRIWKRLQEDMSLDDYKRMGLLFDELSDIRENLTGEVAGITDIHFDIRHGPGSKRTILKPGVIP